MFLCSGQGKKCMRFEVSTDIFINSLNTYIMEYLIKIFVFILLSTGLFANTDKPSEGSTLQVIAPSGLNLRTQPSMDASSILTMPHGAEVTLLAFEDNTELSRVEWVDGKWMKVEYNGIEGWAFDGFLTVLNVPSHDLELTKEYLDLGRALEMWARHNFYATDIDTVLTDGSQTVSYDLENNQFLRKVDTDVTTVTELHLEDVRVMEVYQLINAMITDKDHKRTFSENAIFIEKNGVINHVKVNMWPVIIIKKTYDNQVQVIIEEYHGC